MSTLDNILVKLEREENIGKKLVLNKCSGTTYPMEIRFSASVPKEADLLDINTYFTNTKGFTFRYFKTRTLWLKTCLNVITFATYEPGY